MIECECCKNAREFVEKLDLSQALWSNNNWSSYWIFRGQADAEWPLIPAALRTGEFISEQINIARQIGQVFNQWGDFDQWVEKSNFHTLYGREKITSLLIQIYAEINNLREFFDLGEGLSLNASLPLQSNFHIFGSTFAQDYIANIANDNFGIEIWNKSFIAIAQHHGVATRLLDWTKNPLYAAYFACEGIQENTTNIAVYATLKPLLDHDIRLIEVSKSHSPYIHAQQGLFTFDTKVDLEFLRTGRWRGMEDVPNIRIRKFTLPVEEVSELSRILWLKQITRAHMMPTLDNVILALKTKWKFQLEEHQRNRK